MTPEQADAYNHRVAEAVTLITDNKATAYEQLHAAARAALDRIGVKSAEDLRECQRGGGPYTESVIHDLVGDAVADVFREWFASEQRYSLRPWIAVALADLMDLGDTRFRQLLGAHYMPQPDHYEDATDSEESK